MANSALHSGILSTAFHLLIKIPWVYSFSHENILSVFIIHENILGVPFLMKITVDNTDNHYLNGLWSLITVLYFTLVMQIKIKRGEIPL